MSPSPLIVRSGAALIHVNAPELLPAVLEAIGTKQSSAGAGSAVATLAEAASQLLQDATVANPSIACGSVRDVIYHYRARIGASDLRFLQQLQTSYSLLRHMSNDEILTRCSHVGHVLRGSLAAPSAGMTKKEEVAEKKPNEHVDPLSLHDTWAASHVQAVPHDKSRYVARDGVPCGDGHVGTVPSHIVRSVRIAARSRAHEGSQADNLDETQLHEESYGKLFESVEALETSMQALECSVKVLVEVAARLTQSMESLAYTSRKSTSRVAAHPEHASGLR